MTMNLTNLFAMQKVLDEKIMKQHPELVGKDNLPWKLLALQVEIGECANEWRGFKKWSQNQKANDEIYISCSDKEAEYFFCGICHERFTPEQAKIKDFECEDDTNILMGMKKKNPLLEEYVDCLHFILSIGLELGFENVWISHSTVKHSIKQEDVLVNFSTVFAFVYKLERRESFNWYDSLFERFIVLGFSLGFTWEQIEQAYIAKNEVNHDRQNTGY